MTRAHVRVPSLHRISPWILSASGLILFVLAPLIAPGEALRGPSSLPSWVPWIAPPLLYGLLLVGLPGLTVARRVFGTIALCAFHAGLMLAVPPIVALLDIADPWPWVESLWGFPAAPIIQLLAVPLVAFPLRDLLVPPSRRWPAEAERMPTPSPLRTGRGWDDAGTHTVGGERLREESGEPQPTPDWRRAVRDFTPLPPAEAPRPLTSVPTWPRKEGSDTGRVPTGRISAAPTPPRALTDVPASAPGLSAIDMDVLAPPPPPAPDLRTMDTEPLAPAVPTAAGPTLAPPAVVELAITEPLVVQPSPVEPAPTEPVVVVEPVRAEPVRVEPAVVTAPAPVESVRTEPIVVVEPPRVEPGPPAAPAVAPRPVVEPVREATGDLARPLAAPVVEPSPPAPPPLPMLEPAEISRTLAPAGALAIEYQTLMGIGLYMACGPRLRESVVTSMAFRALALLAEAPTAQAITQVTLRGAAGALVVTPLGGRPGSGPVLAVALPQRGALALLEILALRVAGEYRAAHAAGAAPPATAGTPAGTFREVPVPARVGALVRSRASGESLRPISLENGSLTLHLLLDPGADAERLGRLASDLYRLVELEAEPGGVGPLQSVVVRLGSQRVVVQPVAPEGGRSTLLVAATPAADRPGLTRLQLERVAGRLGGALSSRI